MGRSTEPTSRAGLGAAASGSPTCASQSKPSSLTPSPAWMRIRPTSSRVSWSEVERQHTGDEEVAHGLARTVGRRRRRDPGRIWTRAPAGGTLPPSQVSAADQGPLWAERTSGGKSAAMERQGRTAHKAASPRAVTAKPLGRVRRVVIGGGSFRGREASGGVGFSVRGRRGPVKQKMSAREGSACQFRDGIGSIAAAAPRRGRRKQAKQEDGP